LEAVPVPVGEPLLVPVLDEDGELGVEGEAVPCRRNIKMAGKKAQTLN
jgi:hypothetical protein